MIQTRHRVLIDDDGKWRQAWDHFYYSEERETSLGLWTHLAVVYKCFDLEGTGYVEFETEEDATFFLMRWI